MLRGAVLKGVIRNQAKATIFRNDIVNSCSLCNVPWLSTITQRNNLHSSNLTYNFQHATKPVSQELEGNSKVLTEKEYLVKIKNDPDTFGPATISHEKDIDEGDLKEDKYFEEQPLPSQKLRTKQYADIIKGYLQKHKVKEAIDVLEVRMIKEDRVKPENYIFNLIIGACGRVGYTKKAFSLYNQMKKRALKVTPGTYTALFNACANSPWPQTDGLTRAQHLRNIMIEKMYEPNDTNYNAMIKAFGRCGDLTTAFALVDEMIAKKFPIHADTLNFLLQACITDKDAGFRHALLVWNKFIEKKIQPNIFSYNLMLRCIRDCGLGDIEVTKDVITKLISKNVSNLQLNESTDENQKEKKNLQQISEENLLEAGNSEPAIADLQSSVSLTETDENTLIIKTKSNELSQNGPPNLMAEIPHLGNILSLSEVTKPSDRLLLVGGYSGFLQNMDNNKCKPDIKTFTQMLDSLPDSLAAENEFLAVIKKHEIRPDIDFFNMLIKKRSMRFEYDSAKAVLKLIKNARLIPDLVTYGVLALACKTREEAQSLIQEMSSAKYRLNAPILGAMLKQACCHNNFPYVIEIMELCLEEEIKPNKQFMECLDEFKKKCKKFSNDKENPLFHSKLFQRGYQVFKMRYKTWLQEVQPDDTEDAHPWQQYRQETDTDVIHFKDKEASSRFKPRHSSLFRKKTSEKHLKNKNK